MTEPVKTLLDAMAAGVAKQTALLSAVVPRVSPEYAVVAAATEGLLRLDGAQDVVLERKHKDTPIKGKCDLSVKWASDTYYFEFKCLWPGGLKENLRGISADLEKLAVHPRGFAVVFCYAITKAPEGCERWQTKDGSVDATLELVQKKLRKRVMFESSKMTIRDYGVSATAKLVAWRAATAAEA